MSWSLPSNTYHLWHKTLTPHASWLLLQLISQRCLPFLTLLSPVWSPFSLRACLRRGGLPYPNPPGWAGGGLDILCSHSPGGWKSKIKVRSGWISLPGRHLSSWLADGCLLAVSPHGLSFGHMQRESKISVPPLLLIRTPVHGVESRSLNTSYLLEGPFQMSHNED